MRRGPQLLTYPDSLGGTIAELTRLLRGPLAGEHVPALYAEERPAAFASGGDFTVRSTVYASIRFVRLRFRRLGGTLC